MATKKIDALILRIVEMGKGWLWPKFFENSVDKLTKIVNELSMFNYQGFLNRQSSNQSN